VDYGEFTSKKQLEEWIEALGFGLGEHRAMDATWSKLEFWIV